MAAINLKMITVNMFVAYDMLIHLCPYDMLYSFIKIVLPLWG